jgi:zinc protease
MNELLNIEYKKFKLKNGLEVILYRDNSLPLVTVNIWYKVGSANECQGKTGFAHLFEHMMFQGSENVPKEKHFKYIQEAGGSLNGSTSFDRTNYYETVPSDSLELALWLESDRMGFLLPAMTQEKLENQIGVVSNERRERYENQPYGLAWELIFSNLYPQNHPYSWPTIGWMEDIQSFKLNDIKNFFKTYYAPNNASLVIAGDIEVDSTIQLVEKYFDELKSSTNVKSVIIPDDRLSEKKLIVYKDSVPLPRIYLAWNSDYLYGKDDATLDILSEVLSGSKNSRLYKKLVFEKQIVQDISTFQYSAKYEGTFIIIATAKPEIELDLIKSEIFKELETLKNEGINNKELSRSKNSIKSSYIYSLQKISSLADTINNYNYYLSEPNSFSFDLNRYQQIDKEFVRIITDKYLSKPYVELRIIPGGNDVN